VVAELLAVAQGVAPLSQVLPRRLRHLFPLADEFFVELFFGCDDLVSAPRRIS
jgi:hypothetical protein